VGEPETPAALDASGSGAAGFLVLFLGGAALVLAALVMAVPATAPSPSLAAAAATAVHVPSVAGAATSSAPWAPR
jgi:hypothetical protein